MERPSRPTTLSRSLTGLTSPQCYMLISSYPAPSHDLVGWSSMTINPSVVERDMKALRDWVARWGMEPGLKLHHDSIRGHQATARNIRKILQATRAAPTFIYFSGHGAKINGENAYLPSDCIMRNRFATDKVIPDSELRTLLTAQPAPAPLVLVTDFCASSNFLRLPYALRLEGDEAIWGETDYRINDHQRPNSIIAHFSTGCQAGTWPKPPSCGVFTQAFYNIQPDEKLSLREIMLRLKLNVGEILNEHDPGNEVHVHRQYKVYCSHKFDDAHFFEALGFNSGTEGGTCNAEFCFDDGRPIKGSDDGVGLLIGARS